MHYAYDCGGGGRKGRLGFQGVEENSGNGLLGGFLFVSRENGRN